MTSRNKVPQAAEARHQSATSSICETSIHPRFNVNIGRYLAFSVDDTSIQMAAVRHLGHRITVLDVHRVILRAEPDSPELKADYIANTIQSYVSKFGGRRPKVSLVISGKETAFRVFLMPALRSRDLGSAVRLEARKQIPFPFDECLFDYRPVSRILDRNQARYRIALNATTRKFVHQQLDPFSRKAIEVSRIDHSPDVIGQMLTHLSDFSEEASYTLLNVTQNRSEISVYRGSLLEFLHIGSAGSALLGDDPDITRMEYFAESMAGEIQVSYDYYAGQYAKSFANSIFIMGELTCTDRLVSLLNERISFQFEPFPTDRLDFIQNRRSKLDDTLHACLPALASSVCHRELASLLPIENKRKQAVRRFNLRARFALALLVLLLAGSWITEHVKVANASESLDQLESQVEAFRESEAYRTYNVLRRRLAIDRAYIEKAKGLPSFLNQNLKALSLLTPPPIRLTKLTYSHDDPDHNMTICGTVFSTDIPPEITLAEFVEGISASQFYDNVIIRRHAKRRVRNHFEIEFQIGVRGVV